MRLPPRPEQEHQQPPSPRPRCNQGGDVLVQQVHAARVSRPSSSNQAFRPRLRASAIAALLSLPPPQRRIRKSQESPFSTSARTSATKIRVPLKVTLP